MTTVIKYQYSPEHCAAYKRWQAVGYSSASLSEADAVLIEREDPDAGAQIRRERKKAQEDREKAEAEVAAAAARQAAAAIPAKRPASERLAEKNLPPLEPIEHWKSIQDPGFEEAFERAMTAWTHHPDQLTALDISALTVVDPKYAKAALQDRVAPSRDAYDLESSVERDIFAQRHHASSLFTNFAVTRFRFLKMEARLAKIEGSGGAPYTKDSPVSTLETKGLSSANDLLVRLEILERRLADTESTIAKWPEAPGMKVLGAWVRGKKYQHGDVVCWDGGSWAAKTATTSEPGSKTPGSDAWMLVAMRGREGKQGNPGVCRCEAQR